MGDGAKADSFQDASALGTGVSVGYPLSEVRSSMFYLALTLVKRFMSSYNLSCAYINQHQ